MKSKGLLLALLLAAACNRFEPFTFVQMSDTQIGFQDDSPSFCHSESLMREAVDQANALRPEGVIITGDLVDDYTDPVQDSIFRVRLAGIEAPVYLVPGNHDYPGGTQEKRQAYIARRGYDRFSFKKMKSPCRRRGKRCLNSSRFIDVAIVFLPPRDRC